MDSSLLIIKSAAFVAGHSYELLSRLAKHDMVIVASALAHKPGLWERHYAEHRDQDFFQELVDHMENGVVQLVEVRGATGTAERLRRIAGESSDPSRCAEGTMRRDFGTSVRENAVHSSANAADAERELALWAPLLHR